MRSMVDLAIHSESGEHVTLCSIAERQGISENYLEQVFSALRKAGLVKSVMGAQGGYMLGYDAARITVGDILRVLEGNMSVMDGSSGNKSGKLGMEPFLARAVWTKVDDRIRSIIDSITLEDMVVEYRMQNSCSPQMYYI